MGFLIIKKSDNNRTRNEPDKYNIFFFCEVNSSFVSASLRPSRHQREVVLSYSEEEQYESVISM